MPSFHIITDPLNNYSSAVQAAASSAMGPMQLLGTLQSLSAESQISRSREISINQQQLNYEQDMRSDQNMQDAENSLGVTMEQLKLQGNMFGNQQDSLRLREMQAKLDAEIAANSTENINAEAGIAKSVLRRLHDEELRKKIPFIDDLLPFQRDGIKTEFKDLETSVDAAMAGVGNATPLGERMALRERIGQIIKAANTQDSLNVRRDANEIRRQDNERDATVRLTEIAARKEAAMASVEQRDSAAKDTKFARLMQTLSSLVRGRGAGSQSRGGSQVPTLNPPMDGRYADNVSDAVKAIQANGMLIPFQKEITRLPAFIAMKGAAASQKGLSAIGGSEDKAIIDGLVQSFGGPQGFLNQVITRDPDRVSLWREMLGVREFPSLDEFVKPYGVGFGRDGSVSFGESGSAISDMPSQMVDFYRSTSVANEVGTKFFPSRLADIVSMPQGQDRVNAVRQFVTQDWDKMIKVVSGGKVSGFSTKPIAIMNESGRMETVTPKALAEDIGYILSTSANQDQITEAVTKFGRMVGVLSASSLNDFVDRTQRSLVDIPDRAGIIDERPRTTRPIQRGSSPQPDAAFGD